MALINEFNPEGDNITHNPYRSSVPVWEGMPYSDKLKRGMSIFGSTANTLAHSPYDIYEMMRDRPGKSKGRTREYILEDDERSWLENLTIGNTFRPMFNIMDDASEWYDEKIFKGIMGGSYIPAAPGQQDTTPPENKPLVDFPKWQSPYRQRIRNIKTIGK